jgi:hypothetical protein
MSGARNTGNWLATAYGHIYPLPPAETGRVQRQVPNRADRRRAERRARAR